MKSKIKLTKTVVDDAKPRDKRYTIWDGEIAGFGLRVFPTGTKNWVFEYRPAGGGRETNKSRVKIGSATDITADQARREAKILRAQSTLGEDPQGRKREKRAALTLKALGEAFMENSIRVKRAANTADSYEDALNHIIPVLGGKKADSISTVDVEKLHLDLKETPIMANKALAVLSSMMSYGMKMGLIMKRENPVNGVEKFPENIVTRFLSLEELQRLGEALEEAETVGIPWTINENKKTKHVPRSNQRTIASPHAVAAIRLYLLTGARLREILHLKWSSVDINRGVLKIENAKGGAREIIASEETLDVLRNLKRVGKYVIASDSAGLPDEKPRYDLKGPWYNIRAYAGLDGVRLHDLRHTFASHAVIDGIGIVVVSKLLGHKNIATTMRYAHLNDPALRQASGSIGGNMSIAMKRR